MMEEQKTNKHFDKMMMKAIQEKYSLFVWQSLEGTVEKCELKIKTYKKQLNSMELVLVKGQEENYSKMIIGNRTLNIFIPELSVSFASEVKSLVENKYIILYPPLSYLHHERRKHQRITPIKPCSLEFGKKFILS